MFSIAALAILTLFSAFCSSSETAFFSLPIGRVRLWRDSADPRRKLVSVLLAQSRYLLVLIFMLNTALNVLLQNVASDMFDGSGEGWMLKVAVPLILILVFGEFLPKYLGMMSSEPMALRAAPFFFHMERLIAPFQRVVTSSAETLSRLIFFFLKPEPPPTPKELEGIIEACMTKGVLSPEEASLIRYSLEFEDKEARELMIPRSEMASMKLALLTKDAIVAEVRDSSKTTILLIDETMDRPLGVITGHEALLLQTGDLVGTLASAAKRLFFVPEAMSARRLLQEFSERRAAIACVMDEHGTISGFIEADTLAKTLLGFTHKKSGLLSTTAQMQQKSIIVPGTTPVATINALFQTTLTSEHHSATIGGWLVEMFDGIPPTGTSYVTDLFIFRVLIADDKQIKQLFIQKRNAVKANETDPSKEGLP